MPFRRLSGLAVRIVPIAVAAVMLTAAPASADSYVNQDLVNRMDGSRLALRGNDTADRAEVIAVRGTLSDSYYTEAWDGDGTWDPETRLWTFTLRNRAANKCLQPVDNTPTRNELIVVRPCDGTDIQKWSLREETKGDEGNRWWVWRPQTNQDLAMAINQIHPQYDLLHLDYAYPSTDRLWLLGPNNSAWW